MAKARRTVTIDDLCGHVGDVIADIDQRLTEASDHFTGKRISYGVHRLEQAEEFLCRLINTVKTTKIAEAAKAGGK